MGKSGDAEALSFNLNDFKARSNTYGGLTPRAKRILSKNKLERTDDELYVLKVRYVSSTHLECMPLLDVLVLIRQRFISYINMYPNLDGIKVVSLYIT